MAITPSPFGFLLSVFVLLLCSFGKTSYGFQGTKNSSRDGKDLQYYHLLHLNSLLPSPLCNSSSAKVLHKKSSLQVVHKHGPCADFNQNKARKSPTHAEMLLQDEARVRHIQSRVTKKSDAARDVKQADSANLPAKDGSVVGSANYIVTVGLGNPKKQLSLAFDTGSHLTWTQCEPCAGSCYDQQDPIFAPSRSSTYSNVSCNTAACNSLSSATGTSPRCTSSAACVYGIQYGDSSFSIGLFAKDRLTLTSKDVFNNFLFGCGQDNQGLFVGAAGLLGLGRDKLSLPSQTASKYNKFFSYCLPSSASSTGFLSFGKGKGGSSKSIKFTPLSTASELRDSSFYGLDITGIKVGGKKLSISGSVFSNSGTIIDSGTVITRLPPAAYAALRSAFRQRMSQYPRGRALSILDTCYDFSKYKSITMPKVSIFFRGGVEVPIAPVGILYANSVSQVCLAFAANGDDTDVAIFGNTQQKTLLVAYDGAGERVGFSNGGCQ